LDIKWVRHPNVRQQRIYVSCNLANYLQVHKGRLRLVYHTQESEQMHVHRFQIIGIIDRRRKDKYLPQLIVSGKWQNGRHGNYILVDIDTNIRARRWATHFIGNITAPTDCQF
jgi:hypothetical protein